jgi:RNA polymerase sigma-70 factor (family 1)
MPKDSQLLWSRICENDDINAFEELHALFYNSLCNFTFSYLKEKESCEEVVSDVFVALWQKRKELENIRNIKSYLYTCSKNLSIDLIRKNAIRIQPDTNCYEIEIPDIDENLLSPLEMKEFRNNMNNAIEQLPPQCKLIFKMLINDQLAYKEIADVLNLSRKTVEAQIAIAYKKLSVVLKQIYLPAILLLFILKSF